MLSLIGVFFVLLVAAVPALAQQAPAAQTTQERPPVVLPQLLERANNEYRAGEYQQAAIDYSLFILLNPTFSQGYFNRALNYEALGDSGQAIQDLSRALDYNAPSPQYTANIYLLRAQLYLNQNNVTAAMDDLDASIAAFPDSVNSLALRAQLLIVQQSYPAALADYDRLIQLQPDQTLHYLDRGFIHAQLGNLNEALADYTSAIDLSPDDSQPYIARALFYSGLNNFTDALADINDAISINPNSGELYLMRGSINSSANKLPEAADDYFRWITLNETRRFAAQNVLTNSQNFTIEMGPGWVYNIPFAAAEGQTVSIAANSLSDQQVVDPLLVILSVSGIPLVADDDSGGNLASLILDYEIPQDGEYTLIVSQAGGGAQQGNVAVRLQLDD
jgi:tetratricopeptide (TPR) repeat protein